MVSFNDYDVEDLSKATIHKPVRGLTQHRQIAARHASSPLSVARVRFAKYDLGSTLIFLPVREEKHEKV